MSTCLTAVGGFGHSSPPSECTAPARYAAQAFQACRPGIARRRQWCTPRLPSPQVEFGWPYQSELNCQLIVHLFCEYCTPRLPSAQAPLRVHGLEWAGQSVADKLAGLRRQLAEEGAGALLVTMLGALPFVVPHPFYLCVREHSLRPSSC